MIYITGDCHRDYRRFNTRNFPEQKEIYLLDWLDSKPYTTLFVDGNHENFDRLYTYPEEEWNGGKIHRIRDSVIHLMRGQVFTIDKKKIFIFGGASSHDISGGILEPDDPEFKKKKEVAHDHQKRFQLFP